MPFTFSHIAVRCTPPQTVYVVAAGGAKRRDGGRAINFPLRIKTIELLHFPLFDSDRIDIRRDRMWSLFCLQLLLLIRLNFVHFIVLPLRYFEK